MRNVVMIGPQGSGKGTQSELLALKLGVPHITTGTLFRGEIARGSELGKQLKTHMDRGELVPTEITDKVMADRLEMPDAANGAILDGFPRTLEQADTLDNIFATLNRPLTHVVYLNVTDEEALRRLTGRRVCQNNACETNYHVDFNPPKGSPDKCDKCGSAVLQRTDDTPDAIRHRLGIYHVDTVPLIALYQGLGLLREVDGSKPIGEVQQTIIAALGL